MQCAFLGALNVGTCEASPGSWLRCPVYKFLVCVCVSCDSWITISFKVTHIPELRQIQPTSFPGSLFSASIVVEKTTMEAEKRDPGNEVEIQPNENESLHPQLTILT